MEAGFHPANHEAQLAEEAARRLDQARFIDSLGFDD
jgi:hypothetical protein